jgi:thiol-disulfide isomerase/thioredoxin
LACERILEDYADDADFIATVLKARTTRLEELREFLGRLSEVSGNESLRALSLFALATSLQSNGDPQDSAQAVELLERIVAEFPDVRVGGATLKQVVEPALFRTKHLSIGSQPPDISGRDQDGVEFRLSDYRGKVVVLDFWADWCPHCQAMYPLERELVEKYADQPFAVLGVNCDEPARFQRVVASKQVTWRNWADGPQGPISRQYRIESFPTIYVLDHEGVIRYKNVRGQQLAAAVAELVAEAASPDPPSAVEEQREETTSSSEPSDDAPRTSPLRTWTTKDGRRAKLRFVALAGQTVRFALEDGREAEVPLARLSDEDQAWIRRQQED